MTGHLKLGTKYFLSLFLISLVPLAVASVYNYFYSKARLEEYTMDSLHAVNDSRAAHINHLIQLRQEQAKELAGTYIIRQLRAEGGNFSKVTAAIQNHIMSVFHELKARPRSRYKNIDRESAIENISVWDIHGKIVANTNKQLIGKVMPFKFLYLLHEQGAFFEGFQVDPLTREKYLTILEGVRNWDTNEYSGVVFLKTKAKILNDITTAGKGAGRTAETYLVDQDHLMITGSRFVKNAVLSQKVETPATGACFSGRAAPAIYNNYLGHRVLGVQTFLPDQNWCLISEIDVGEAFAPVIAFRNRILLVFGAMLIVIMILLPLSSRSFVRPIIELRDASLKIAKGDYDVTTRMDGGDELGELSRAFSQMAKILASTTKQLEEKNRILERQKEELKRFDELKSEFVSMVSHELRTPMAIIKGSIDQLLEESSSEASEETRDLLGIALRNINRLNNLINNLLDLSKIEAGKVELHPEKTDLVPLIREVAHGYEPEAKKKGLEVRTRASHDVIEAVVDRDKIIQVLLNLIGNSMKFVEQGYIEVSLEKRDQTVICHVRDTGPGISQYDLQKVFDKFQQFGKQKPRGGTKGTGLGLSISKGIIDLHQGRIWVESELGTGTTFSFQIPLLGPAVAARDGDSPEQTEDTA